MQPGSCMYSHGAKQRHSRASHELGSRRQVGTARVLLLGVVGALVTAVLLILWPIAAIGPAAGLAVPCTMGTG